MPTVSSRGARLVRRNAPLAVLFSPTWIAGVYHLGWRQFLPWNLITAIAWTVVTALVAYWSGPAMARGLGALSAAIVVAAVLLVGISVACLVRRRRARRTQGSPIEWSRRCLTSRLRDGLRRSRSSRPCRPSTGWCWGVGLARCSLLMRPLVGALRGGRGPVRIQPWSSANTQETPPYRTIGRVLAITLLVLSLGLADSINPVTIAVAIYLASTPDPQRRLAGYTVGVFAVYLAGGLVLIVGPGVLLRTATQGRDTRAVHLASLVIGVVVIALAIALWANRRRWAGRQLPDWVLRTESSFWLGAAMTALDLPTAFPYFGAIGAVVSSDLALPAELVLLIAFNVLYVLPLVVVLLARPLFGVRAEAALARIRDAVERLAPVVLSLLTFALGVVLVIHGASGLEGS